MSLLREAERCIANQKTFSGLNAFITPLQRSGPWLNRVRAADDRTQHGKQISPLDGRLIAVKDNICTRSMPTTCASRILDRFTSPFDATVVQALERAGAVIAGKTNMDEFGMGSHSVYSRFGPVRNSRGDQELSAGGSSGGSAVAVATEQCYAALGTDTGGSIRLPAAYTGTVGFKPSYGLLSRWGVVAYANSLDTVGILARSTAVARDVFRVLNQHDHRDPTNLSRQTRERIASRLSSPPLSNRLISQPLRIGVPLEYNLAELAPSVRDTWRKTLTHLENHGHSIHVVSLPSTKSALSAYYVIAPAEASSNLARYDGIRFGTRAAGPDSDDADARSGHLYAKTRGEGFGAEVQRRILLGAFSLSADAMDNYFVQAQRVRRLVQEDFNRVFAMENPLLSTTTDGVDKDPAVDVLICPTAATTPPPLSSVMTNGSSSSSSSSSSTLSAYVMDVFTVPASLAGLPAVSVPVAAGNDGKDDTVGIQVIGQYGDDEFVLRVAELIEQV